MSFCNRSLFYSLPLLGADTGQVESFRSYIQRLALAHCMTPRHLLDIVEEHYPLQGVLLQKTMVLKRWNIQTSCPRGTQLLSRFMDATTVQLGQASLARFGAGIGPSDLLRSAEWVYCPHCLASGERYSRLLWDIRAVMACPVHRVKLIAVGCGALEENHLSAPTRVTSSADCGKCGAIGFSCNHVSPLPASDEEVWVADAVADVLALPIDEPITAAGAIDGLRAVVDECFDGKPVRAALESGIARANVHHWLKHSFVPSLTGLIAICARSGADLSELLRGRCTIVRAAINTSNVRAVLPRRTYNRVELDIAAIRQRMRAESEHPRPITLAGLAKELQTSTKRLRELLPHDAAFLVAARQLVEAEGRTAAIRSAYDLYVAAARSLAEAGELLSPKNVQSEAALVAYSLNPVRQRALLDAIAVVEAERSRETA